MTFLGLDKNEAILIRALIQHCHNHTAYNIVISYNSYQLSIQLSSITAKYNSLYAKVLTLT